MKQLFVAGATALALFPCRGFTATFTVTNNFDTGAGSFYQAITDANTTAGSNTITFNIPGGGPQIIEPYTWLPAVTNQVLIDGTTQPGYAGAPLIVLNGDNGIDALTISAQGCAVKGMVFDGFGQASFHPSAALLLLSSSNTVTACYVGVNETGAAVRFNDTTGILISNAVGNVIGGLGATNRNLIGGNLTGVFITGPNASNNVILGNWFSLSQDGSTTLQNNPTDIIISNAPNNTVGGIVAAARNVFDAEEQDIVLTGGATSNTILGNFLNLLPNGKPATNATGFEEGILVQNAIGTVIGGTTAGARNVISGCDTGVQILNSNTTGTVVEGNYLGTDPTGMTGDFNYESVSIQGSAGNFIGGTTLGAGNVIVGEGFGAVAIDNASSNVVQGNFIGTDATGMNAIHATNGTLTAGIIISTYSVPATGNLIGGLTAGASNVIAGLTSDGVYIGGAAAGNNIVEGNSIGVAADGVTALGNAGNGVDVYGATSNLISANVIGYNGTSGAAGVYLYYATNNLVINNSIYSNLVSGVTMIAGPNVISENSIYGNGGLGIDNGNHVQTANTPNGNSNYPILTAAHQGSTDIDGNFNGTPNCTYHIEFAYNLPSPFPQMQFFLGSTNVTTDASGNATFHVSFETTAPQADLVTATATATCPYNPAETSQISPPVPVSPSVTIPPATGPTSCANHAEEASTGCPISMFTGELFNVFPPDLLPGGPLAVEFTRYYASFIKRDGLIAGRLGDNWLHNYEMTLTATASNTFNVVNNEARLIPFTNSAGNFSLLGQQDIPFQLVKNGANYILADPRSQMLYTFDPTGKLITVADGHGNTQTLNYSGTELTTVSDGLGRTLTFLYSGSGFLTNVSDGSRSVGFVQTDNNLTSVIDPLGFVTTYSYDPTNVLSGLMTAMTLPEGNVPISQTFNTNGQVVTQTSAGTNVISLEYASPMTSVLDPLGNITSYVHSPVGQVTSMADEQNHFFNLGYNAAGQRSAATNRLGQITSAHFHAPSGYVDALTDADGTMTTLTYTNRLVNGITFYDLSGAAYPDGTSESFTYDASGNALTHTDRAGKVFSFTYNNRGQTLTGSNPLGGVTTRTYDAKGRLATQTDSDVGLTTFQYDSFDHLTNVIHPDGTRVQAVFDDDNRLLSLGDERNNATTFAYDDNNRVLSVTNANSKVIRFTYDTYDRMVLATDRLGHNFACGYNALDRVASLTNRNGFAMTFSHDSRQRLSSVADPAGKTWSLGYDDEARPLTATNPLGHVTSRTLNQVGFATMYSNALGQTVSVTRDVLQRITNCVDALNRTNSVAFEARSLPTSAAAPLIGEASFQLNDLGGITVITDLNGRQWRCAYTPMGRLREVIDPLNRTNGMSYDAFGRPSATTFSDGGTCSNTYDPASNPIRRQYSGGPDFQYTYDNLNRPVTAGELALSYDVEDRVTNTASSGINQGATYDADGRLIGVSYNNGAVTVTYGYDSRDRLIQVSDSLSGAQMNFAYDDSGRLTGITRANGVNGSYTYDAADRLTRIQEGAVIDLQYTLDPAGEIASANFTAPLDPADFTNPIIDNFTYDAAHQIANPGYAWDSRGRQTASPGHTFSWDGASRLTGMDAVTLGYNGLNDIVTRAVGGVTTRFFYNLAIGMRPPVAEKNDTTGVMQRYYVWSPAGRLLYMIDAANGNAVSYFLFDRVGSTLALTAGNGAVTDTYAYSPYGVLLGRTGANTQPFTFVGAFGVRAEGGIYQMRARDYDPASARFLTRDPVGPDLSDVRTLDPYHYAAENPLNYVDPYGQCTSIAKGLVGTGRAAVNALAASKQAAADVALAKANAYAENAGNDLLNWFDGYLNGTVWENQGEEVAQRVATTEEEAAKIVNFTFGHPPSNPLEGPRDYEGIFDEFSAIVRRRFWWQEVQQKSVVLEEEALLLAKRASKLKTAGHVLAVVGIAIDTGSAIHDDYNNGAGWILTITDTGATLGSDVLVTVAPGAVGATDLVSGGGVTGLLHNGLAAPNTTAVVIASYFGVGRMSSRTAVAIDKMSTRCPVTRFLWDVGVWISGGPPIRAANY